MASKRETKRQAQSKAQQSILLISSDGKVFEVSTQDAKLSTVLTNKITKGEKEIELKMDGDFVALITVYLESHKGVEPPEIPKPIRYPSMVKNCGEKDGTFIDAVFEDSPYKVFDLLIYSKCLQIQSLTNLCHAKIAQAVKGNSFIQAQRNVRDPSERDL